MKLGRPATPAGHLHGDAHPFHPPFWVKSAYIWVMPIYRVVTAWDNFPGAPGYTNLFFAQSLAPTQAEIDATTAKVRAFWNALITLIPNGVTLTTRSDVDEFDIPSGELTRSLTAASVAVVTATGTGGYSAAAGACLNWATGEIVNGHRLRGRTFVVPLAVTNGFDFGTLMSTAMTTLNSAATTLRTAASGIPMAIWHRPTAPGADDGVSGLVTGHSLNDKTAVLRSRRD